MFIYIYVHVVIYILTHRDIDTLARSPYDSSKELNKSMKNATVVPIAIGKKIGTKQQTNKDKDTPKTPASSNKKANTPAKSTTKKPKTPAKTPIQGIVTLSSDAITPAPNTAAEKKPKTAQKSAKKTTTASKKREVRSGCGRSGLGREELTWR